MELGWHWKAGLVLAASGVACCTLALGDDFTVVQFVGSGGTGGVGGSACSVGFDDCTAEPGCETDIGTSADHCGACDHVCSSSGADARACVAGVCVPTCQAGLGDCSSPAAPTADDGCETTLGVQTACAACGHDCGGGTCTAFACDPFTVYATASLGSVRSIVVNADGVFWSDRKVGYVSRVGLDGGPILAQGGSLFPGQIAVDATHMYWNEDAGGLVWRIAIDGSGSDEMMVSGSGIVGVGVSDTYIYVTDSTATKRQIKDFQASPTNVGISGSHLLVEGSDVFFTTGSSLRYYSDTSGAGNQLFDIPGAVLGPIAVDPTHVFWFAGSSVYQGDRFGGNEQELTTGTTLAGIAAGNGWVYYTDQGPSEVRRVPVGGGNSELLVASVVHPQAIAIYGNAAYFSSRDEGNVYKLILPP